MTSAVMLGALGTLHSLGYPVSWREVHGGGGRLIKLPTYPWQRERHWHESEASRRDRVTSATHPLLGRMVSDTMPTWRTELSTRQLSYLKDHRVQGRIVFPAAGYIEMMAAAAHHLFGQAAFQFEEVEFHQPLFLSEEVSTTLQLRFDPQDSTFTIHSRNGKIRRTG